MNIECFFTEGCTSLERLRAHVEEALQQEGMQVEVHCRVVTEEDARRLGIPGSPTVRIDGKDLEGINVPEGSVS